MSNHATELLLTLQEELSSKLDKMSTYIPRRVELPHVPNKINVVLGMRRVGKTNFLLQQVKKLNTEVGMESILYINFEDDRLRPMSQTAFTQLVESFYKLYPDNHHKHCYLFLDEIQYVEDWPLTVRRLFDTKPVSIVLTGSSSKLLSKEIATSLRGRCITTELWPFSFDEHLTSLDAPFSRKKMLSQSQNDQLLYHLEAYLKTGGFPEMGSIPTIHQTQILQDYVNVVTLRDIIERYNIHNHSLIHYLIKTLLNLQGGTFSITKFFNDTKSRGLAGSRSTIYDYLDYIEDTYLGFLVPLFDESYRKAQANPKKVYCIDTGLANAYTFTQKKNLGHAFENLVYLDLRRLGCEIFYYLTTKRNEVDFYVRTPKGEPKLIQVAWSLDNEKTRHREERALSEAKEETKAEGIILTPEQYIRQALDNFIN